MLLKMRWGHAHTDSASECAVVALRQHRPSLWDRVAGELPWPVLLAACSILMIDFGMAFGTVVFFPAVQASLQVPAWHLTFVFSASASIYLCLGLLSGPIADRRGAAPIIAAGQGVLLVGLSLAAVARSELVFAIGYVTAIGGGVGLTYVPTLVAVQHRAPRRAPLAAGIAGAGVGLGALFGASFRGLLSDRFGWRMGLVLAAATALAAASAAVVLIAPTANASSILETAAPRHRLPQPSVTTAAKASPVRLYGAYALAATVAFVPFSGLVDLGREVGWRPGTAIAMIGIVGVGSATGRLLLGGIADRFGACRVTGACALVLGVALTLMSITRLPLAFAGPAFAFGAGYGGMSALTTPSVAEIFGSSNLGRSVGRMMTAWALGLLIGPWLVALASEHLGGHRDTWLVYAAISIASGWLFLRTGVAKSTASRAPIRVKPS